MESNRCLSPGLRWSLSQDETPSLYTFFLFRGLVVHEAIDKKIFHLIWISVFNCAPSTWCTFNTRFPPWILLINSIPSTLSACFPLNSTKNKKSRFFFSSDYVSKYQILAVYQNFLHLDLKKIFKIFSFQTDNCTHPADFPWPPESNLPSISLLHQWTIEIMIHFEFLSTKQFSYVSVSF